MLPLPLRWVVGLFGLFELDVRLGLGLGIRLRRWNGRVVVTVVAAAAGAGVVFVEFCVFARTLE